jgi:cobalamin biosynthesis protein CobT
MAKAESFANDMKNLAKGFDSALKNANQGGAGLSVGDYQVKVTKFYLTKVKKGKSVGHVGAVFQFEVVTGAKSGKKHSKFQDLNTVNKKTGDLVGLSIFLGDLETMGIKMKKSDMKNLQAKGEEAVGKIIEITVKKNDGYTNTYINDLVQDNDNEEEEEDEEEEEEEADDNDEDLEEEEDEEEEDEDELEDEEEEEEPEPPKKRGRGRPKGSKNKKKAPKKQSKKAAPDDDEDLDDIFED